MTLEEGQARFRALSNEQKVEALLIFMYELTIAMRVIYQEYAEDNQTQAKLAYDISETNHRLSSAAIQILADGTSFTDETLVEMMCLPSKAELAPHFPYAFERAMSFFPSQ